MLLPASEKHGLDLGRSIMIGDKDSDMQAASKAGAEYGATVWQVLTGGSCPAARRTKYARCERANA